ncbi:hypothetical protein BDN70DRAFT_804773 [Pholiota conissans]|uniref:MULE transposase domain-containing protein n=1 Tax=Pholiota conissans TaxID=109636 RepID=A0A9P5Z4V2_9AGAR|nr:hypothetical protein BDN70DRAFT_804773 [Pholiota conissans]
MDVFRCSGWIHITIMDGGSDALVKFKHDNQHIPYWNIDVPEETQQFVRDNLDLSPTQLWDKILEKHADELPKFPRKSIYKIWHQMSSKKWTRDPNEMESVRILLDEFSKKPGASPTASDISSLEVIPLPDEEGFTAIAFCLPEILRKWGSQIREISLDSTFKTNGSNFEVYALLGEVSGSGCPLAYLLIQSSLDGTPGGKERYIQALLSHLRTKWNLKAIITLSDKDFSEINAFRAQFPEAKHQLCFWHALRAIKIRLSVILRRPKFYDVKEAKMEFDFIDEMFVPIGQETCPSSVSRFHFA